MTRANGYRSRRPNLPVPASALRFEAAEVFGEGVLGMLDLTSPAQAFSLGAQRMNGFVRLVVTGELDIATAPSFEDALAGLQDHGTVIVDLGGVTFIDVSGLHIFAAAERRARSDGSLLVIVNCRRSVRRLFEVTGTEDLLDASPVSELFDADDNAWIPMQLPVSRREIVSADPERLERRPS